jgi:hypothetical protein
LNKPKASSPLASLNKSFGTTHLTILFHFTFPFHKKKKERKENIRILPPPTLLRTQVLKKKKRKKPAEEQKLHFWRRGNKSGNKKGDLN